MTGKAIIGACAVICAAILPAHADNVELGPRLSANGAVKVFVDKVANESGESVISAGAFKRILEESFSGRKATRFQVVGSPDQSDITVSAKITKYRYLERGPLKPTSMFPTTLVDAAATMTHNYADMASDFTVIMTSTGQTLWNGTVEAYVKRTMSPQESIPLIFDKLARRFISKCFGNPRSGSVVTPSAR